MPAPGAAMASAVAILASLGLAGCSQTHQIDAGSTSRPGDSPTFSGPYADDFRQAYEDARSNKVRRILADGRVTAQEFASARSGTNSCMRDNGYYLDWDTHGGGFSVGAGDEKYPDDFQKKSDPILQACERENDGGVTFLYQQTTLNPQNIDQSNDILKCLRSHDLVPKGYAKRDWDHDNETGKVPFDEFDPKAQACQFDPLSIKPEGL